MTWGWFDHCWKKTLEWTLRAKLWISDIWLTEYANLETSKQASPLDVSDNDSDSEPDCDEPASKRQKSHDPFQRHAFRPVSPDDEEAAVDGDEYEHWQNNEEKSDRKVRDPIRYWHERRQRYPRLSRMALDFITVQAMSSECERLFSAAGRMMSPLRSQLDVRMLGMCQVLRSWYRSGLIKDLDSLLLPVADEIERLELMGLSDDQAAKRATAWLEDPSQDENST